MSQFNSPNYSIARHTGRCALTDRELEPGTEYMATVVEDGDELVRVDVSLEAWEAGERPERLFSYWKTTVPEPDAKPKPFVDNEVLLDLLRRLGDAEQPNRQAFRFVLTLILMRKKMLRYDKTIQKEGERPIYEMRVPEPEADADEGGDDGEGGGTSVPPADAEDGTDASGENDDSDEGEAGTDGESEAESGEPGEPGEPGVAATASREGEAEPVIVGYENVMQDWWLLTPKLDPAKGPLGKWHPDETIEVLDPHLDEVQIRLVTDQLGQILNAEL